MSADDSLSPRDIAFTLVAFADGAPADGPHDHERMGMNAQRILA